jgi:hypothetical protein
MKAIFSFLLLVSSGLTTFAQDAPSEPKKEPAGRVAWFVAASIPDDLENPVKVMVGKEVTEMTLSKRMASDAFKIPADGLISIIRKLDKPDPVTQLDYTLLAQARIPDGMSKSLIILLPVARKEGSSMVFQAKVQDLAGFTGGDYLFLNLTTLNMAVQLGDSRLGLRPGDTAIHRAGALDKPTNTPVSYLYYQPQLEKWKLISASTVVMQSTRREICIFSWDPQFSRVDYHGITFPVTP